MYGHMQCCVDIKVNSVRLEQKLNEKFMPIFANNKHNINTKCPKAEKDDTKSSKVIT